MPKKIDKKVTKVVKPIVKPKVKPRVVKKVKPAAPAVHKIKITAPLPEFKTKVVLPDKEILATGKRKTAIAQVKLIPNAEAKILVNNRPFKEYFPYFELQEIVLAPLKLLEQEKRFQIQIKVKGGGVRGQAEAIRLGIAKALVLLNADWRKALKPSKFLTRDSRIKERKKPGLKRARKAPQWHKR